MKKYIIMLAVAVAGFTTAASAQSKVAHINSQLLVEAMPEAKAAQAKIQSYADTLDKDFKVMQDDYQTKVADFQDKQKKGLLSQNMLEVKADELQAAQQRLQAYQQTAEQKIQAKQAEYMKPVIDKAKKGIDDVAKEKGYAYVIDTYQGILLVMPTGDDILPLVKAKLGIK